MESAVPLPTYVDRAIPTASKPDRRARASRRDGRAMSVVHGLRFFGAMTWKPYDPEAGAVRVQADRQLGVHLRAELAAHVDARSPELLAVPGAGQEDLRAERTRAAP